MSARAVLVVGTGKRVREATLPVLHRMEGLFEVRRLYARTRKALEVEGRKYEVAPLAEITSDDLAGIELVYLAVAKDAVPAALATLTALEVGAIDLLIDTPVVRFRHFRHAAKLRRFRNTWVPEECARLPWFDTVRAAVEAGAGRLERVVFDRSAYAYHGVASAKALLGAERVLGARRRRVGPGVEGAGGAGGAGGAERELRLSGGLRATVVEPRDYAVGGVELHCASGVLSDTEDLRPVVAGGRVVGFELAGARTDLDADEAELTQGDPEGASVTARMHAMKRVGLLRLLRDVHAGRGGYALEAALEDMVVDYWLEKVGRYIATPLTDPRSGAARALLNAASRLGGG